MNKTNWILQFTVAAITQIGMASAADAPAYPNKPVKLIVPYVPGGSSDIIARVVTDRLGAALKQPFIIENRGGAGGVVGTTAAAKAPPDGYTLLLGTQAAVLNSLMSKTKPPYDIIKDFAPISLLYSSPLMLVVIDELPVRTVKELITYAKKEPGKLNYASAGTGSPIHVAAELFKFMTQTDMVHVAFKGGGPAMTAMLGGEVHVAFNSTSAMPYVKSGKMRALGVSTKQRVSTMPDVPTIAEAGVPGYEYDLWYSMVAPAKTPAPIISILNREIVKITADPQAWPKSAGGDLKSSTPEGLATMVQEELDRLGKVVKAANITLE